jgi:hypothetical protein
MNDAIDVKASTQADEVLVTVLVSIAGRMLGTASTKSTATADLLSPHKDRAASKTHR